MTASEYNKCVDLHSHAVFRFALKQLRNTDDAKEIVQISFEKLWMKHQNVDFETAKSYLFTTAYHSMVDRKSTCLNSSHVSESRMPSSA